MEPKYKSVVRLDWFGRIGLLSFQSLPGSSRFHLDSYVPRAHFLEGGLFQSHCLFPSTLEGSEAFMQAWDLLVRCERHYKATPEICLVCKKLFVSVRRWGDCKGQSLPVLVEQGSRLHYLASDTVDLPLSSRKILTPDVSQASGVHSFSAITRSFSSFFFKAVLFEIRFDLRGGGKQYFQPMKGEMQHLYGIVCDWVLLKYD